MRKAGTISYTLDLKTSEVVFFYQEVEVRLPISMGQSARSVILSYVDKIQRGTRTLKTRSSKSQEDHQVMMLLVRLVDDLGRDYEVKAMTIRTLEYIKDVEGVNEELKKDVENLISHLKPKQYVISKENANKLNLARLNNKKAYKKMYNLLEDDINIFKDGRRKILIMIADVYEKHKSKVIIEAPRSVTKDPKPMYDWY